MDATLDRRAFLAGSAILAAGAGLNAVLSHEALAAEAKSAAGDAKASSGSADAAKAGSAAADKPKMGSTQVDLHRGYAAAHGSQSFAQAVVAVLDGKILAANVDEYQFLGADTPNVVPVPNSGTKFDEGIAEGKVLASKTDNDVAYSAMIAEKAGSTQSWRTSMTAIEAFAAGKTPAELADLAQQGIDGSIGIDTVSGATLEDTFNYLKAIADVAANDVAVSTGWFDGDPSSLVLRRTSAACRTTHATANAVALTQGDRIVAASVDEFEFEDASSGLQGVPNSDADLAKNFPEGKVLVSKRSNDEAYSALMAKGKRGSQQSWVTSMTSIEETAEGLRANEATRLQVETLTGSTLACGTNYAAAIALAASSPAASALTDGDYATDDGVLTITVEGGKVTGVAINGFTAADELALASAVRRALTPVVA